jgi:PAS domain S-box-containing protein
MTAGVDTITTDAGRELQKLKDQVAAYEETLDNIGAYIFIKDLKGRYIFANKMVRELFKRDLEGIIGHDDTEFFSLDLSDDLIVNDRLVMEQGKTIEAEELNVIAQTSETRYYKTVKKPLRNEDGVIIGMYGISTDVTQYRILEKELQEKQKLLDTVLKNVDACIYMKDNSRHYLYLNEQTASLFGHPINEILGKTDEQLLDKELSTHLSSTLYIFLGGE